jgi:NADPH:quinone reductase-like Zn-dependent oxidoreductase/NADP-dependent 3-hydroxy acid dehydrogenase YdfG
MLLHTHPEAKVVELVKSSEDISNSITSQLPVGIVLPNRIRYAIVDNEHSASDISNDTSGQSVFIHANDEVPPSSAELYVISHQVNTQLKDRFDDSLDALFQRIKPADGAFVTMVVPASASESFKARGFDHVGSASVGSDILFLCRYRGIQQLSNGNGVHHHHETITILEPTTKSPEVQLYSNQLKDCLTEDGYTVTTKTGVSGSDPSSDRLCISLLELEHPLLNKLSEPEFQSLRKLWVGCEHLIWITGGDDPLMGMVDGLSRCVNVEVAGAKFQVLHLSTDGMRHGPEPVMRVLASSGKTKDNEFRERGGMLQVPRMFTSPTEDDRIRHHLEDATRPISLNNDTSTFHLTIGKPGLLDTLHFVSDTNVQRPLADHELELDVRNTGLNFRDVVASMGLIPIMALGQEASGYVLRAGRKAAESFKPGDRVSTLSVGGTHATRTLCDYRVTAKIPDTMSFAKGAAAPMVYAAAYHALVKLAKVRRGQSILVHAAAGGLGQAAVQLAIHLGLVVYATVGTEDKRHLIMERYGVPGDHIFNSRDASFAQGIRRITDGRGVDCVLNSLSGELLRVSWTCLATFGTFIEVGLRDITDNMRLDMRPFSKCATFTSLDIPTIIEQDPAAIGEALTEVFKLLHDGTVQVPYPLTLYPAGQVEEAFRTMQQGKHRGKIVLSFEPEDRNSAPVLCKASDSIKLDPNATFLFVGGLGGLGRSLAKEFVASGARYIAFISRSGDTKSEAKAVIEELRACGTEAKAFHGDIADRGSFLAAMEQCSQQMPPVKGVIQMAMVLRDALIENMTYEEWVTPLQPKVEGTWNLHEYFGHNRPLDFMIFCSSFSGLCGSPGQAQYGAGNSYQDALARHRHNQGLKAISVNLGIMLSVGILAEMGDHTFKLWEDVLGIREQAFHSLIKSLVSRQAQKLPDEEGAEPMQVCLGLGTADIMASNRLPSPPWYSDPRFGALTVPSTLAATNGDGENVAVVASLSSRLSEAGSRDDITAAASIISEALVAKIADILRIPASEIDPHRPLYLYGVDSLVALEVRNWITREIKANMALLDILAAVPIEVFAAQIAQKSKLVVAA